MTGFFLSLAMNLMDFLFKLFRAKQETRERFYRWIKKLEREGNESVSHFDEVERQRKALDGDSENKPSE